MLDRLRNARIMAAATSAGIIFIATIIGAGVAAAQTKTAPQKTTDVMIQNNLQVSVQIRWLNGESNVAAGNKTSSTRVDVDEKGKYKLIISVSYYSEKKKTFYPCTTGKHNYINSAKLISIVAATDEKASKEYGPPGDCKLAPDSQ